MRICGLATAPLLSSPPEAAECWPRVRRPRSPRPTPPYLGLSLKDIGLTGRDLLAERLLANGDPDPEMVKSAAPPHGSATGDNRPFRRFQWDTFVGTKECSDTMPVYPPGNTRTYHPIQYFPDLNFQLVPKRFDGLVGGWMPAVRKVFPVSDSAYYEVLVKSPKNNLTRAYGLC